MVGTGPQQAYDETMSWVFIMILIFIGAPLAKAFARSIEHRSAPPSLPEAELRNALQAAEQRLSDNETRLAMVEEKLDFYEKLLAKPKDERNAGGLD
jgi:hypothetical protein